MALPQPANLPILALPEPENPPPELPPLDPANPPMTVYFPTATGIQAEEDATQQSSIRTIQKSVAAGVLHLHDKKYAVDSLREELIKILAPVKDWEYVDRTGPEPKTTLTHAKDAAQLPVLVEKRERDVDTAVTLADNPREQARLMPYYRSIAGQIAEISSETRNGIDAQHSFIKSIVYISSRPAAEMVTTKNRPFAHDHVVLPTHNVLEQGVELLDSTNLFAKKPMPVFPGIHFPFPKAYQHPKQTWRARDEPLQGTKQHTPGPLLDEQASRLYSTTRVAGGCLMTDQQIKSVTQQWSTSMGANSRTAEERIRAHQEGWLEHTLGNPSSYTVPLRLARWTQMKHNNRAFGQPTSLTLITTPEQAEPELLRILDDRELNVLVGMDAEFCQIKDEMNHSGHDFFADQSGNLLIEHGYPLVAKEFGFLPALWSDPRMTYKDKSNAHCIGTIQVATMSGHVAVFLPSSLVEQGSGRLTRTAKRLFCDAPETPAQANVWFAPQGGDAIAFYNTYGCELGQHNVDAQKAYMDIMLPSNEANKRPPSLHWCAHLLADVDLSWDKEDGGLGQYITQTTLDGYFSDEVAGHKPHRLSPPHQALNNGRSRHSYSPRTLTDPNNLDTLQVLRYAAVDAVTALDIMVLLMLISDEMSMWTKPNEPILPCRPLTLATEAVRQRIDGNYRLHSYELRAGNGPCEGVPHHRQPVHKRLENLYDPAPVGSTIRDLCRKIRSIVQLYGVEFVQQCTRLAQTQSLTRQLIDGMVIDSANVLRHAVLALIWDYQVTGATNGETVDKHCTANLPGALHAHDAVLQFTTYTRGLLTGNYLPNQQSLRGTRESLTVDDNPLIHHNLLSYQAALVGVPVAYAFPPRDIDAMGPEYRNNPCTHVSFPTERSAFRNDPAVYMRVSENDPDFTADHCQVAINKSTQLETDTLDEAQSQPFHELLVTRETYHRYSIQKVMIEEDKPLLAKLSSIRLDLVTEQQRRIQLTTLNRTQMALSVANKVAMQADSLNASKAKCAGRLRDTLLPLSRGSRHGLVDGSTSYAKPISFYRLARLIPPLYMKQMETVRVYYPHRKHDLVTFSPGHNRLRFAEEAIETFRAQANTIYVTGTYDVIGRDRYGARSNAKTRRIAFVQLELNKRCVNGAYAGVLQDGTAPVVSYQPPPRVRLLHEAVRAHSYFPPILVPDGATTDTETPTPNLASKAETKVRGQGHLELAMSRMKAIDNASPDQRRTIALNSVLSHDEIRSRTWRALKIFADLAGKGVDPTKATMTEHMLEGFLALTDMHQFALTPHRVTHLLDRANNVRQALDLPLARTRQYTMDERLVAQQLEGPSKYPYDSCDASENTAYWYVVQQAASECVQSRPHIPRLRKRRQHRHPAQQRAEAAPENWHSPEPKRTKPLAAESSAEEMDTAPETPFTEVTDDQERHDRSNRRAKHHCEGQLSAQHRLCGTCGHVGHTPNDDGHFHCPPMAGVVPPKGYRLATGLYFAKGWRAHDPDREFTRPLFELRPVLDEELYQTVDKDGGWLTEKGRVKQDRLTQCIGYAQACKNMAAANERRFTKRNRKAYASSQSGSNSATPSTSCEMMPSSRASPPNGRARASRSNSRESTSSQVSATASVSSRSSGSGAFPKCHHTGCGKTTHYHRDCKVQSSQPHLHGPSPPLPKEVRVRVAKRPQPPSRSTATGYTAGASSSANTASQQMPPPAVVPAPRAFVPHRVVVPQTPAQIRAHLAQLMQNANARTLTAQPSSSSTSSTTSSKAQNGAP